MKRLPNSVRICECWARDGLQGEAQLIPPEKKIEIINRMMKIGIKKMEVTSFSHPKLVPQFADGIEVLKGIDRPDDVSLVALIPNDRGLDRLLDACDAGYGVTEIITALSASEDHLLANLEAPFADILPIFAKTTKRAKNAGLKVIGCIGTSFGCPLAGDVPIKKVIELTEWYLEQGADSIMYGDTTGEANPLQVRRFYQRMYAEFPGVDFIAHFHDTRGMGLANTLAALQEGVVYHDSSFGAIGGQPASKRPKYHRGLAGNSSTEDMVLMMEEMGIDTGIDVHGMLELVRDIETLMGRQLSGHVARSGTVRHMNRKPLSIHELKEGEAIQPALFYKMRYADVESKDRDMPGLVVREALKKIWPLPEGISMDTSGVDEQGDMGERGILITRFDVVNVGTHEAVLEVLSQKPNGDVYLNGNVKIHFS